MITPIRAAYELGLAVMQQIGSDSAEQIAAMEDRVNWRDVAEMNVWIAAMNQRQRRILCEWTRRHIGMVRISEQARIYRQVPLLIERAVLPLMDTANRKPF